MGFKMKKIFLIMLCMVLLVTPIMAEEVFTFDNVKEYDEETQTITIINTFNLGRDIATIQLITPMEFEVPRGEVKIAELEIDLFDNTYTNAFDGMDFYDLTNKVIVDREFIYKYKTTKIIYIEDYKESCALSVNGTEVCTGIFIGTHEKEVEDWVDFDTSILYKGKITLGIFTNVQAGDNIEWVPTLFGKEIDEFASWTESLNVDLLYYWKLDEASGSVIDVVSGNNGTNDGAVPNVAGKVGTAYDFEFADADNIKFDTSVGVPASISMAGWIKVESFVGASFQLFLAKDNNLIRSWNLGVYQPAAAGFIAFQAAGTQTITNTGDINAGQWHHVGLTFNDATNTVEYYLDGVNIQTIANAGVPNPANSNIFMGWREHTSHVPFDGVMDEWGIWGRILGDAEMEALYNGGDGLTWQGSFLLDTCACPGATEDWEINMTDNCNITSACDLTSGSLSFVDEGWTICDAAIDTTNMGDPGNNAVLYLNSSCVITVD